MVVIHALEITETAGLQSVVINDLPSVVEFTDHLEWEMFGKSRLSPI